MLRRDWREGVVRDVDVVVIFVVVPGRAGAWRLRVHIGSIGNIGMKTCMAGRSGAQVHLMCVDGYSLDLVD